MTRTLVILIVTTDVFFLIYWAIAGAALFHLITLPPEIMYGDYDNPRVVAWNWSFFPLDILFSVTGFFACYLARAHHPAWRPFALISLVLTMTAGGMAIAYWTILQEFDPSWFLPNLILFVWPLFFMKSLVRGMTMSAKLAD